MAGNFNKKIVCAKDIHLKDFDNLWNITTVCNQNVEDFLQWLWSNNLLLDPSTFPCPKCNSGLVWYKKSGRPYGILQCSQGHALSVLHNSFFSNSQIPLPDHFMFMREFVYGSSLKKCCRDSGISYTCAGVTWASYYRDIFIQDVFEQLKVVKLRGVEEIDESLFGNKIKYHRGAKRCDQIWIFGLVERNPPRRLLMFPVVDRSAATLLKIIVRFVEPGSTIYSDGWAAYNQLSELGFIHYVVNHKETFQQSYTNSVTGEVIKVNTNLIECSWKYAKQHFKVMNGTSPNNIESHLCEVLFRNWYRGANYFTTFIEHFLKCYPLVEPPRLNALRPVFDTWCDTEEDYDNLNVVRTETFDDDSENVDSNPHDLEKPGTSFASRDSNPTNVTERADSNPSPDSLEVTPESPPPLKKIQLDYTGHGKVDICKGKGNGKRTVSLLSFNPTSVPTAASTSVPTAASTSVPTPASTSVHTAASRSTSVPTAASSLKKNKKFNKKIDH